MADQSFEQETISKMVKNAVDADLVAKVVEHELFRLRLGQEVQVRTRAELGFWWKIVGSGLAALIIILTYFGAKEIANINGMRDDISKSIAEAKLDIDRNKMDMDKTRNNLTDSVDKTVKQIEDSKGKVESDKDSIQQVRTSVEGIQNQLDFVIEKRKFEIDKAIGSINERMKASQTLLGDAQLLSDQLKKDNIEGKIETLKTKNDEASKNISDIKGQIEEARALLKASIGEMSNLQSLSEEVGKTKTFAYLLLESRGQTQTKLANYKNPKIVYTVTLTTKGLRSEKPLIIQVSDNNGNKFPDQEQRVNKSNVSFLIDNTNGTLMCEVMAIHRYSLLYNFMALKIYANSDLPPTNKSVASSIERPR